MTLLVVAKKDIVSYYVYTVLVKTILLADNVLSHRLELHYYPLKPEQTNAFNAIKMHLKYK